MKQMSKLKRSKVICMQKQQTDMKPGFKKQMFLPFKASVIKHNHLEAWSRRLLQGCVRHRNSPWWRTLPLKCCSAWALCWNASWSFRPQTTGSRFLTRHYPWKCKQNVSDLFFTCMLKCDSGTLNLHWPTDDRAPARLYTSAPPPPVASQWSQPIKTRHVSYNLIFAGITDIRMMCNVRLPNPGAVRHIVPVRSWEIKQALQNLLEESFLVIAAAAQINTVL